MDEATAAQRAAKLEAKRQKQQQREAKQQALVKEAAAQRFKAELEQIKQLQLGHLQGETIMQQQPTQERAADERQMQENARLAVALAQQHHHQLQIQQFAANSSPQ